MADIDTLRDQLIEELWLPIIKEAGTHFYNRRRNKQMKLFTLSNGVVFNELIRLEAENLIQRGSAVLWVSNMIKAVRAETESRGAVLSGSICDEAILGTASQVNHFFPCDILNLDFSSQDTNSNNSRVERELEKTEQFMSLQSRKRSSGFVLLHTTIINNEAINGNIVKNNSDAMHENGWGGLILGTFPQPVADNNQKHDFIKHILQSLCQKYKYRTLKIADAVKVINANQHLISIAGIFVR
ncbi:MAG TPA: hypothetical protein ACFYD7_10985 [Candidatus Wujingus californicus]|uniref:hypothetical protein n=1 Tax=Candidatus Wujingus californicus TaxID=3367618 RepID=UPI001DD2EF95|nr:hypothetical protein [Planctomycetota bacterium]MDO8131978.1 hypothetical protein [Candidatus Brocadiales bacterium]